MTEQTRPGPLLIRSFLIMAVAYLGLVIGLMVLVCIVAAIAFPETFALWTAPPGEQPPLDPEQELPTALGIAAVAIGAALSFVTGYLVSRFAPFGPIGHGFFLAVIIFVNWLQVAISDSPLPQKPICWGLMILMPLGVIIGAQRGAASRREPEPELLP